MGESQSARGGLTPHVKGLTSISPEEEAPESVEGFPLWRGMPGAVARLLRSPCGGATCDLSALRLRFQEVTGWLKPRRANGFWGRGPKIHSELCLFPSLPFRTYFRSSSKEDGKMKIPNLYEIKGATDGLDPKASALFWEAVAASGRPGTSDPTPVFDELLIYVHEEAGLADASIKDAISYFSAAARSERLPEARDFHVFAIGYLQALAKKDSDGDGEGGSGGSSRHLGSASNHRGRQKHGLER